MSAGSRLRTARQARGFSQQQLAGMAGVSRQAVSAVEAGQSDPSLRVALALARALGMTVEELFGPDVQAPALPARLVAPSRDAGRVSLAAVGEGLVALPLTGTSATRAGFLPAGGIVAGSGVRPLGPPRPTLIVAGCDPALPLLELPLSLLDPPIGLCWWPCSSEEALGLAARGLVHVAGAHLRGSGGEYNTAAVREALPGGSQVIGFCSWQEGLVLRRAGARGVTGVADVVARGMRVANREPGAEARRLLDRELERIGVPGDRLAGYDSRASGHLEVAGAVAAGLADAGVASEPAALAYDLEFVPLARERFDLVVPAAQAGSREVQALTKVLSSRWLGDQLASLPGYDPSNCGDVAAV